MHLTEERGYRLQLSAELKRRQNINPRYSLRSFAKSLDISPAFLSKVLNFGKNLSIEKAYQVADRLKYSTAERAHFIRLVELEKSSTPVREALRFSSDSETSEESAPVLLQLDAFQAVADWHHYALRELIDTRDFNPDPKWIAQRLGIPVHEARGALQRLERLGLIERRRGTYVKTQNAIMTPTDQPSRALRTHHGQMINLGRNAIEQQSVETRDISGVTIPISLDKLPLAKAEIRKFRRKMMKLLDSSAATEVYQLNVQFFRLTKDRPVRTERTKKWDA